MVGDRVLHADTSVHLHTASVSGLAGEGGHSWSRVIVHEIYVSYCEQHFFEESTVYSREL